MQFFTQYITPAELVGVVLTILTTAATAIISFIYGDAPRSWHGFVSHVIPPESLTHPSARADYLFFVTVRIVNSLIVLPIALSAAGIGYLVNELLQHVVLFAPAPESASLAGLVLFTLTMLVVHDFGNWVFHYAMHKMPALWELHKVHHSAERLVAVTRFRVHPIEVFINRAWDGITGGIIYGVWLFFAYNPVEIAIFGINIYQIRSILMLETTRHTHYKITFGRLISRIVISPHYHQLHHSTACKHWDKNFGTVLALWDQIFGTFKAPEAHEEFVFGLANSENIDYRSCLRLYVVPLQKLLWMLLAKLAAWKRPETTS